MRITEKSVAITAMTAGILCCLIYLRTLACGFVNLDDPLYVVDNVFIRHLDRNLLSWAFSHPIDFWIPFTFISFALDYHFWHLNPVGYHLTNILLHAVNTGLVVLMADTLLRDRFAPDGSDNGGALPYLTILALAGLFFGIHPLRVESVAWITERKDVLNGVFSFGSLLCYLKYARQHDAGVHRPMGRHYLLSLALFGMSLLAKSSSVVIPVLLLVADYYPLERFRRRGVTPLLQEKIPFFALAFAVALTTLSLGSQKKILLPFDYIPLFERITISGNALFEYCRLLLFPVGIVPFYQIPNALPLAFLVKTCVVLLVTILCLCQAKQRPLLFAGWIAFLLPFLPVLAFFQNGSQMLAARYTYLPSLVPSLLAAAGMATLHRKLSVLHRPRLLRHASLATLAALLILYGGMTLRLIPVWDTTETLWSRVIEIRPIGMAYKDRGIYYLTRGRFDAAIADFTAAIDSPEIMNYSYAFNFFAFRGLAFELSGRPAEAVADFTTALESRPLPHYYLHRGRALMMLGKTREAQEDLQRAGPVTGPMLWSDR